MQLNYLAIFVATILQFVLGAVWYTVLFGKLWGEMHGFDKLSKDVQQKMQKEMGPFYGLQLLMTLITTFVLALFITYTAWNPYALAGFFWLGFTFPAQVSAVVFGGTEKKWMLKKIAIQSGAALCCLEIAAIVLHIFG